MKWPHPSIPFPNKNSTFHENFESPASDLTIENLIIIPSIDKHIIKDRISRRGL